MPLRFALAAPLAILILAFLRGVSSAEQESVFESTETMRGNPQGDV